MLAFATELGFTKEGVDDIETKDFQDNCDTFYRSLRRSEIIMYQF